MSIDKKAVEYYEKYIMKQILSVFFNTDRIYLTAVEPTAKGLILRYVNSTESYFDLENPQDDSSVLCSQELEIYLSEMNPDDIEKICVTIPAENVLVTQFPGMSGMTNDELRELVNLEIRQTYKLIDYDNFVSSVVPLMPRRDGKKMMLAAMIQKKIIATCKNMLLALNRPIDRIDIAQLNAHNSFLYNYPEHLINTVAIFGIQKQFIDVSLIVEGMPVCYYVVSMNAPSQLIEICSAELARLKREYAERLDCVYYFGLGLNQQIMTSLENASYEFTNQVGRMNAFRMMTTNLVKRDRDYCSRTAHVFPPCIGAAIPAYHDTILISQ